MKLSSKSIGVRAVDINKCLQNIEVSTPHIYFETTDPVGAGIRLAANIQGLDIIENNQLKVIASNIGIKPMEMSRILEILADLNYVNIIKDSKTSKTLRIEETVPLTSDCFEEAGKYILEHEINPIEMGGVYSLDKTSICPLPKEKLRDELNELDESNFETLLSCGVDGQFLDKYIINGKEIIYSPYLWDIKDTSILEVIGTLSEEQQVLSEGIASKVKGFQGIPEKLMFKDPKLKIDAALIHELVAAGILNKCSVETSTTGKNDFYFLPSDEMNIKTEGTDRNDIFNKIKNVISCVRQGQYFAPTTQIFKPRRLLESLLYDGIIGKRPHSDIREQYALLEIEGIARAEKVFDNRYKLVFNRTEENEAVLKAAISFFESETIGDKLTDLKARLLVYGAFKSPEQNRTRTKKPTNLGHTSIKMMEVLRGERHDFW